jgi:hypothetical protein
MSALSGESLIGTSDPRPLRQKSCSAIAFREAYENLQHANIAMFDGA